MAEPVIRVEHLGKKYRIGKVEKKADTITGTILKGLKSPLTNLKQIRNLSKLDVEDDSIFWALRDVSFDVHEGEVLGIIGHNGAGKSTLLKILSQITEPSTGEVEIRGRVAALLEVGTGFHPELSGRENIYMNGTILGMTKKEINCKLDEIVNFSGVEKYLDTPVKFYSSGMRVRLGFAVAAHLEPEILIIDEVLSVGDAEFQKKCLGKMEDVAKNGRTVLFVSHNMAAVQNLCSRAIVLKNGAVNHCGNVVDAIGFYLSVVNKQMTERHNDGSPLYKNELVNFLSARILSTSPIRSGESVSIVFEFDYCGHVESVIDVTFHLFDEMNNLVFVGTSGYDMNFKVSEKKMRFICTIPMNILHEGSYKLGKFLIVRDKGYVIFSLNDLLSFDIIPSQSNMLGWMGKKQGIVKPKLQWSVEEIGK